MQVTLIDYTGAGSNDPDYAINLLIFTKNTRLTMSPSGIKDIAAWPYEKKTAELNYMANSIPSSWEFVNYTFMIEGVTRAFTHQFVRSRHCSFAQQTMRVLDVSNGAGWEYGTGPTIEEKPDLKGNYEATMETVARAYEWLIRDGAAIEDARGILPTNILTNIAMSCNMRTFVELVRKRSSSRTQGEYREVLEQMKVSVQAVHPWIDLFIARDFDKAASDLDQQIRASDLPQENKIGMIKLIDQLRGQS
jgi:flavin-dependent thymidylate synthase